MGTEPGLELEEKKQPFFFGFFFRILLSLLVTAIIIGLLISFGKILVFGFFIHSGEVGSTENMNSHDLFKPLGVVTESIYRFTSAVIWFALFATTLSIT